jgi:putative transposase
VDQDSQFISKESLSFFSKHNLIGRIGKRENCHDNPIVKSFFQLLKREPVRQRTYITRNAVRQVVFDYIEMFINPNRTRVSNSKLSPVDYGIAKGK